MGTGELARAPKANCFKELFPIIRMLSGKLRAKFLRVHGGAQTPWTTSIFISTSLHVLRLFLLALFLPQIEDGFLYLNLMADDRLKLRPNV